MRSDTDEEKKNYNNNNKKNHTEEKTIGKKEHKANLQKRNKEKYKYAKKRVRLSTDSFINVRREGKTSVDPRTPPPSPDHYGSHKMPVTSAVGYPHLELEISPLLPASTSSQCFVIVCTNTEKCAFPLFMCCSSAFFLSNRQLYLFIPNHPSVVF